MAWPHHLFHPVCHSVHTYGPSCPSVKTGDHVGLGPRRLSPHLIQLGDLSQPLGSPEPLSSSSVKWEYVQLPPKVVKSIAR